MEEVCRALTNMSVQSLDKAGGWLENAFQSVEKNFLKRSISVPEVVRNNINCEMLSNTRISASAMHVRDDFFQDNSSLKDEDISKARRVSAKDEDLIQWTDSHSVSKDEKPSAEAQVIPETREEKHQLTRSLSCSNFIQRHLQRMFHVKQADLIQRNEKYSVRVGQLKLSLQYFDGSGQLRVILHQVSDISLSNCSLFIKASVSNSCVNKISKTRKATVHKDEKEVVFNDCIYIDFPAGTADTNDHLLNINLYKVHRLFGRLVGTAAIPFENKDFFLDTTILVPLQHPKMTKRTSDITVLNNSLCRTIYFEAASSYEKAPFPHQSKRMTKRRQVISPFHNLNDGTEQISWL